MAAILDQTADAGLRDLYAFSKLYDFPTYVKQASPDQVVAPQTELQSTTFADFRNRQFPCATKAATWVSYLFFLEKKADMHEKNASVIERRLNQFADYHGLAGDVRMLREKHASLHQDDPLPDSSYMLVWASEDGKKERHYPLVGAPSVKQASEWFEQYRYHYGFEDRRAMATKLLDKIAAFNVPISEETFEMLEKQAGRGTYVPSKAAQHIRNRVKAAFKLEPELQQQMLKLAQAVEDCPGMALMRDECVKLAKTIDDFDQLTHIQGKYSDNLPSPEDMIFEAPFKQARAFVDSGCTLTTGSIYDRNDFRKLALSDVRDMFGDDLADEVSLGLNVDPVKMAEVAATLPRNEAALFDQLLSDCGVRPIVKQATAIPRFEHRDLQRLAALA